MSESPEAKIIRCAVYTRKSTEKGLENEYNSLDAQRESAENYIKSQKHNGWRLIPEHYDDGGYSGGNTERPALKRLMEDIKAGKIDILVIYKMDRLSRSLLDFMNLAEFFEQHNVSFVSVTQDINTSTSSGRMMLNILMAFGQYERE
ncbi:MAG: recombinase family protein, partial [Victivallaceae bacterium]|nr:recombinase family protein [Victivallaceae bacterium]